MRLTCPSCGVDYQVPEGQVGSGRHVQCSACHTRWFAPAPRPAPGEDQILARLEGWSPRPRPIAVPDPEADGAASLLAKPEDPAAPAPPRVQRGGPAKPADRPTVAQPGPVGDPAPPRPAPRLDLGAPPAPAPRRATGRFRRGVVLVLALFAIALAAYRFQDGIAARVPAFDPALSAYGQWIDGLRERLEQQIGPWRARVKSR